MNYIYLQTFKTYFLLLRKLKQKPILSLTTFKIQLKLIHLLEREKNLD